MIKECRRQEESCLYTSTALFEWLKHLRFWRVVFVVAPIVLGAIATWPLLRGERGLEWVTGICAMLAGLAPAVYKALNFDMSLEAVAGHAHQFKVLQDRFRQAWAVVAFGADDEFKAVFDSLMDRMDAARAASVTPPERFFVKAQSKIKSGDYTFTIDGGASPTNPTGP